MRILALITDGFGGNGGIARYNCDLMTALGRSSYIEQVLALPRFGAANALRPEGVVQYESIPNAYLWASKALALAVSRRVDAIFCGHLNAAPFVARVARVAGKPLWVQTHGIEAWADRGDSFRRALVSARLVTSVSRYTRRKLLSWSDLDPDRVRVLPNTFDASCAPAPRRPDLVARYGLKDSKVILTVGRMSSSERYKGHDRIIHCLPRLAGAKQPIKYLIVGTGDDCPRLEELASQLGVRSSVVFAGHVPTEVLGDHYALADVFAMPSTGEGFGIVFLEAAASGLPVVGGSVDGSTDPLADGAIGRPVDPESVELLTQAIMDAMESRFKTDNQALARFGVAYFTRQLDDLVSLFSDKGGARHERRY